MYIAHSQNSFGTCDPLWSHLGKVADRAAEYAQAFGAANEARVLGLLHDVGKYGDLFQRRLEGKESGIDHWSAGAWVALQQYKMQGIAAALSIQGHHIGLLEASKDSLSLLNPSKLTQSHPLGLRLAEPNSDLLLQRLRDDGIVLPASQNFVSVYSGSEAPAAGAMLDVRMLFSALVDADFLETEAHFDGRYREPGLPLNPDWALPILLSRIDQVAKETNSSESVRLLRADLLRACLEAANLNRGLFTLTAPTGAGKTLAMLAFALRHAKEHQLRRIIIVIPYLTIIDQTVREYRKVLKKHMEAEEIDRYILEHHSLAGLRTDGAEADKKNLDAENEARQRARLLAENWDAPVIITTSVQFLESLFANRPSGCRKLHRLAKSVILFDEVQTLPLALAVPTLAALSHLASCYQATVLFSTATQPAFGHLDSHVGKYSFGGWKPREIVPDGLNLFDRARRTCVEWPDLNHPTRWAELAEKIEETPKGQALCIVNLKKHALALFNELRKRNASSLFHLSTNMCPAHRKAKLDEVEGLLKEKSPCYLVSTQCVEAGVDIDFPEVFRALGPLDAIIQAAGRCNREGGSSGGTMHVFLPEEDAYPDATYRQAAQVTRILLHQRGPDGMDINDPDLSSEYYRTLYDLLRPENRNEKLLEAINMQNFELVAKAYRVIDKDAINVLVPYEPDDKSDPFRELADEVRTTRLTRSWIAKARPYTIGLFRPRLYDPISAYLEPIRLTRNVMSDDWFIYLNKEHYSPDVGLIPPLSMECLIG